MATRKRSTTPRKRSTGRKAPTPTSQDPEFLLEPAQETAIVEAEAETLPDPVVTVVPEPAFAARVLPPPPPRPLPDQRRGIFLDVENTSRPEDIETVLRHLMIDRIGIDTDFTAVGNWRVIGHETARLLAQTGAHLVHSAPSVGVRDWSDLRIAVAAGVWLAGARPGDMIDVVSDDQAFDAVGDVAASLGVQYRRLSYRSLTGHVVAERMEGAPAESRSRGRRGRGGRGRRGGRQQEPARHRPYPQPVRPHAPAAVHHHAPAAEVVDAEAHTAPHDELIDVVRDLMVGSPGGVTLDQLSNGLRSRGFRRTPGSPRLITRLKRIKELDVSRNGMIRLVDGPATEHVAPARATAIDPDEFEADMESEMEERGVAAVADEAAPDTNGAPAAPSGEGGRRRRRRRGGRRRRGRRGNGGGAANAPGEGPVEVVAAAAPAALET
ncbi:MAG TPA: hypothetical protein VMS22_16830 [Candidatus Eisenbacteria bacterium]|nr:hypothetical protein [Candidatus Eisenbacteria bacterium]